MNKIEWTAWERSIFTLMLFGSANIIVGYCVMTHAMKG